MVSETAFKVCRLSSAVSDESRSSSNVDTFAVCGDGGLKFSFFVFFLSISKRFVKFLCVWGGLMRLTLNFGCRPD